MRINIASFGGRSHLLDTARELEILGHDVLFYSYIPNKRAKAFGLKSNSNFSFFYYALPFLILFKICNILKLPKTRWYVHFFYQRIFDFVTGIIMRPCHVFIGQSPMHIYSIKQAKKRFNALTILERGTSHVIDQVEALNKNPFLKGKNFMPTLFFRYELQGFNYPDYISVGSNHVKQSFLKNGFQEHRIFVNNYGFNTNQFFPTLLSNENFDLIFVGQFSFRKGSDLLIKACIKGGFSLLHVGSIVDVPFPNDELFHHVDPVDQSELSLYYSKARVFVIPSREEGLALVQAQALACGLPLVCSKKTGGIDLVQYVDNPEMIIEIDDFEISSIVDSIKKALSLSRCQSSPRNFVSNNFHNLSWKGYGKRYNSFLLELIHEK